MFRPDSYLTHPPDALAPDARILLQATAFSLIAAHRALMTIRFITAQRVKQHNNDHYSQDETMELYSRAWTLVDEIHALRACLQLLNKQDEPGFARTFVERYESATLLRNTRDHLMEKLGNLAQTKKSRASVLGYLTYVRFVREEVQNGIKGKLAHGVIIPFGAITHKSHKFHGINPGGKIITDIPCLFEFGALDERLELDGLFEDLPELARYLDDVIERNVLATCKAAGVPVENPLPRALKVEVSLWDFFCPDADPD